MLSTVRGAIADNRFVKPPFVLLEEEKQLFSLFLNFCQEKGLNTTIRVAGGWVRDKILNRYGHDIDISIDNISGRSFSSMFKSWAQSKNIKCSTSLVFVNPEKSKHLETAIITIGNWSIDVVNLRSENYTASSRIPTMKFGTPEMDAMRRDLTINSLFYNIHSGYIEDYTGLGMEDIKNRVVRSVASPMSSLTDDPLRSLRSVRFASVLGFQMDRKLEEAISFPSIIDSLKKKVSRERITDEIAKLLDSNNFDQAISILYASGILEGIFSFAIPAYWPDMKQVDHWEATKKYYIRHGVSAILIDQLVTSMNSHLKANQDSTDFAKHPLLKALSSCPNLSNLIANCQEGKFRSSLRMAYLTSMSRGNYMYRETFKIEFGEFTLKNILKFSYKEMVAYHHVQDMIHIYPILYRIKAWLEAQHPSNRVFQSYRDSSAYELRSTIGNCLRHAGIHWKENVLFSLITLWLDEMTLMSHRSEDFYVQKHKRDVIDSVENSDEPHPHLIWEDQNIEALNQTLYLLLQSQRMTLLQSVPLKSLPEVPLAFHQNSKFPVWMQTLEFFLLMVEDMKAEQSLRLSPLLNGIELTKILPKIPQNKKFAKIIEDQLSWMMNNPQSDEKDLISYLESTYSQYK